MNQPLTNLTKAASTGGKLKPYCTGTIAAHCEATIVKLTNAENRFKGAHDAVKDGTSVDADFMTDEQLAEMASAIRSRFLECLSTHAKQAAMHREHRSIHVNRQKLLALQKELAAAQEKFL
ncbi:MAG: hypothetical protein H7Z11_16965 [Verrucomicrobia bacterium]|nr:hypothetical protein [Leptolyngbya sp. ES-bin-22]